MHENEYSIFNAQVRRPVSVSNKSGGEVETDEPILTQTLCTTPAQQESQPQFNTAATNGGSKKNYLSNNSTASVTNLPLRERKDPKTKSGKHVVKLRSQN